MSHDGPQEPPEGPEKVMRTFAVEFVAPRMAFVFVHWRADRFATVGVPPSLISETAPASAPASAAFCAIRRLTHMAPMSTTKALKAIRASRAMAT